MSTNTIKIVTLDSPEGYLLHLRTKDIQDNELPKAQEIANQLISALEPYMPAAGLAAPQIGISKSIFIYSFDRSRENLEVAINPSFSPLQDKKVEGWENCFSVFLSNENYKLAKVPRYEKILVSYLNFEGEKIEKTLEGFGAKVFQHEYDHLMGIVNINHPNAVVKTFASKEELTDFMDTVKKEDSKNYLPSK